MMKLKILLNNQKNITLLVSFLIILATIVFTIKENWHLSTNGANPGIISNYLGVAISRMVYGSAGYVGYNEVLNEIQKGGANTDSVILNKAMSINNPDVNNNYMIVGLDLGFVDYCHLAFYLFGNNISSLLYLYFLILFISIILFIKQFSKLPLANLILVLFLMAHYITITTIPNLGTDVGVVYNPRLIVLLSLLPLFHIIFSLQLKKKYLFEYYPIVIQSFIILMVIHIRRDSIWIILFIFGYLILKLSNILYRSYLSVPKLRIKNVLLWQFMPLLLMFFLYIIIFPHTLDSKYTERGEGRHKFWISALIGLALHPEIRGLYVGERTLNCGTYKCKMGSDYRRPSNVGENSYKAVNDHNKNDNSNKRNYFVYRGNDQDAYSAVFNRLYKKGLNEYELFYFRPDDSVYYYDSFDYFNSINSPLITNISYERLNTYRKFEGLNTYRKFDDKKDFNWAKYESISYNIILEILNLHPLLVLETIFYLKPGQLLNLYIGYFSLGIVEYISIIIFCFIIYFIYINKNISKKTLLNILLLILIMFLFSITPYMITYPGKHVMFVNVILVSMIEYIFLIIFFSYIIPKIPTNKLLKVFSIGVR